MKRRKACGRKLTDARDWRAAYITGQTLAVDGGFDAIGIGLPTFRKEQGGG